MLLESAPSTIKTPEFTPPFPTSNWTYILRLLGLIIVADRKTLQEEVDAFVRCIRELRAIIDPKLCLTEQMTRDWFRRNKPELEEIIDGLSYDTAICEIIAPIRSMPFKLDVISCMVEIAVSDGEYCDVEKGLIKKTCLYWNVRSNFQQNLENIHKTDDAPMLIEQLKSLPKYDRLVETYR
jgi:uncharacterized tellurite resistance protein B-like protein